MGMMFNNRAIVDCPYSCCSSLRSKGRRKRKDNYHRMLRSIEKRQWQADIYD
jgi:hypothetical protein